MVWFPGNVNNILTGVELVASNMTVPVGTDVFEVLSTQFLGSIVNPGVIITLQFSAGEFVFDATDLTVSHNGGTAVDVSAYTSTTSLSFDHSNVWNHVKIDGAGETVITNVAVVSSTSNGASDHDVVLSATGVSSLAVGRYLKCWPSSGAISHPLLMDCHRITNVDTINGQITLKLVSKPTSITLAASSVTGLQFRSPTTTLRWTNFTSTYPDDFGAIDVQRNGNLYQIDRVAIVGDSAKTDTNGVMLREKGFIATGSGFCIANWGRNLIFQLADSWLNPANFAGSGALSNGIYSQMGASVQSAIRSCVSGCSTGWAMSEGATGSVGSAVGCDVGLQTYGVGTNITVRSDSVYSDNTVVNIRSRAEAGCTIPTGTKITNAPIGVLAAGGGKIFVSSTTVTGNIVNYSPTYGLADYAGSLITSVPTTASTPIPSIATATLAHNFGTVSANSTVSQTVTVSGVVASTGTDIAVVGANGTPVDGIILHAAVTDTNEVTVFATNVTSGDLALGLRTYRIFVFMTET